MSFLRSRRIDIQVTNENTLRNPEEHFARGIMRGTNDMYDLSDK